MGAISTGAWLTHDRVIRTALLACATSLVCLAWLFGWSHGTLDPAGLPLGTDFSEVWTAGRIALSGHAADVWSLPKHIAVQQQFHHTAHVDVYGWHYPPPFLLIASALALLPYLPALFMWQAVTLSAFAMLMWRLVPRWETPLLVVAAPVTLVCVTHGQNGFLTALLLGGGLALLERRPVLAGLLLGCLIYKPQFALIVPPLLLLTRNWRAIAGAFASAILLTSLTLVIWGWPVYQAFLESIPLSRALVVEQGAPGWYKIVSPFAAMRMWGGSVALAYVAQSAVSATALAAVAFLSFRDNIALRNAAVTAAALVSTPYALDYDLVVLGLALVWLWTDGEENGFLDWERSLMALVWIAPLFARQLAQLTLVPLGLATVLIMLAIPVRRSLVRASPFRRSREEFAR
jgi:hypothetical protein